MIKSILKWTGAKSDAVCVEDGAIGLAKCCGIGMIEGAIDAFAVLGVMSLGCMVIGAIKH